MSLLDAWRARVSGIVRRSEADRDLDEEMAFHVEMETAQNERRGMSPAEARRRALITFGGAERFKEAHRDRRRLGWLDDYVRDVRFGMRGFLRAPVFALTAVLTLGLAIGAGSIVFSLVNAVVLRPFPVANPGRLVALWANERGVGATEIGYEDYIAWRDESGLFSGLAAARMGPVSLGVQDAAGGSADLLWSEMVTPDYFSVLGLRPHIGRFFTSSETVIGSAPLIVLSFDYWQSRFGGAGTVLGERMLLNGRAAVIIGVAPASFHGLRRFGFRPDVWFALGTHGTEGMLRGRGDGALQVIGRLAPGLTHDRAAAAASVFARRLAQTHPATNRDLGALITSARTPFDNPRFVTPRVLAMGSLLSLAAIGLVLLVASANVAGLMLARAAARQREIAIRLAIGGSRSRLIRQLLAESSLLAAGGGALGVALGFLAQRLAAALVPQLQFRVDIDATVDLRVVAFTALIALASVFVFGLIPALQATRTDLLRGIRGEALARGRARRLPELRELLVIGQLAASLVLIVAGSLFVRSLAELRTADLGLQPEGRAVISVMPQLNGYDDAAARAFFRDVRQRAAALPGIESVSWGFPVPFDTNERGLDLFVDGVTNSADRSTLRVSVSTVDTDFFRTLGTPLLAGRDFALRDTVGAPLVLIVNRTLAARLWPADAAVGRHVRLGADNGREAVVIGVSGDMVFQSPTRPPQPMAFLPLGQHTAAQGLTLVLHTNEAPPHALARVDHVIRETDPGVAAYGGISLDRALRNGLSAQESAALISAVLGALALLLALVGLYGVVAYTVDRRRREVAVRMTLGATPKMILAMMLRGAARLAAIGATLGLAGALLTGRLMASLLYRVKPHDPTLLAAVAVPLTAVVLAASCIAAVRSTRVDPNSALRSE